MNNKVKALIATGVLIVGVGSVATIVNDEDYTPPVAIEEQCKDGELITYKIALGNVVETRCFTKVKYKQLQHEVLWRYLDDDHSNDELLFAMLEKELTDDKDYNDDSVLINGLMEAGVFVDIMEQLAIRENN